MYVYEPVVLRSRFVRNKMSGNGRTAAEDARISPKNVPGTYRSKIASHKTVTHPKYVVTKGLTREWPAKIPIQFFKSRYIRMWPVLGRPDGSIA